MSMLVPDLGLLALKAVKNTFLLFISYSVCGMLYSSSNRLRHIPISFELVYYDILVILDIWWWSFWVHRLKASTASGQIHHSNTISWESVQAGCQHFQGVTTLCSQCSSQLPSLIFPPRGSIFFSQSLFSRSRHGMPFRPSPVTKNRNGAGL